MGMKKVCYLSCLVFLMSAITQALPTYISNGQMTWQRGDDNSTWQEWTFDTAQNPADPEQFYNPYGDPVIEFEGEGGSVPFMWKNGVWMGDPVIAAITVPNSSDPNPYKKIWFEMIYKAVDSILPSVTAGDNYDVRQTYFSDSVYSGSWRIMTIGWTISPNPATETISFALSGTGGFVTSVSVDTLCTVPEPASLLLAVAGLSTIGLIRKRIRG